MYEQNCATITQKSRVTALGDGRASDLQRTNSHKHRGVEVTTGTGAKHCTYYPLSYRVPVRERYGSTLLPATREQHDQNCTQSH